MKNKQKDYKKLVYILDKVITFLQPLQQSEELQAVNETLQEIKDILYDYPRQAEQLRLLMEKYEKEVPAIVREKDFFQCPSCNGRTGRRHSHCHKCGKKLGWGRERKRK